MGVKQANGSFVRLKQTLHSNRYLTLTTRVRLWRSVVFSSLTYGLESTGLTPKESKRLRVVVMRQLRSMAKSPAHISHETNRQLLTRLCLQNPVYYLRERLVKACHKSEQMVHFPPAGDARNAAVIVCRERQLLESTTMLAAVSNSVEHSDLIACPDGGRDFASMFALNAHKCKEHQ